MASDRKRTRRVGRYLLFDRLASGGMASVHIGRLVGPIGFSRTVAIKRMHEHYAEEPEFVAMFLDEARLAARIRHANVVSTLDVVAEDGELLVVMEYVHGESLSGLLRALEKMDERVPLAYAASTASAMLSGLHAAHEAKGDTGTPLGVVHRDVSPQNVIVDVDGVTRVLDFGIAKAAERLTSTADGYLKGKAAYMAPEQIAGEAVDRRTDVFAASVVLWEMLTGRRLFGGEAHAATLQRVLTAEVKPPSAHVPDVPPALDAIVMRGLARDPGERYATARDMAKALDEVVRPVPQREVGAWVEATAQATLERRAALVRAIERESPGAREPSASHDEMSDVAREEDATAAPARYARGEDREAAETATATETATETEPDALGATGAPANDTTHMTHSSALVPMARRPARTRRVVSIALAAFAVVVLGVVGVRAARPRKSEAAASAPLATLAAPSVAAPSTPSPASATSARAEPAAPGVPVDAPVTSARAGAGVTNATPGPNAAPSSQARAVTRTPPARPAKKTACDPPFTEQIINGGPVRVPKPECLKPQ